MKCKFEHDGDCCNCGSQQYMCKCKPKICGSIVPITNADRIRAMSDEELANAMCRNPIFTVCDAVCKGDCKAVDTLNDTKEAVCKRTILEWLQQPAEEDT